ncbi:MAG: hypothetical protein WCQ99_06785 [Pseudomonadota bacterium]
MQNLKTKIRKLEDKYKAANKTDAILTVSVNSGDSEEEQERKVLKFIAEHHPGKTRDDFSLVVLLTNFRDACD